ncbi:MAG: NfeD family protein [Thermoguttaceae bacterium]|nr:NfeD family protein [Thermoguttaceae bacterium]
MDLFFDFVPTQNQLLLLWSGAIVFFTIFEILVPGLVSIWFVFGSIAALLACLIGIPFVPQIFIFLAGTAVTLFFCRPILKVFLKVVPEATNISTLIGMKGVVIERINNIRGEGYVKVNGLEYHAESEEGEDIEADSIVQVERIEGNKLFVKRI